MFRYNDDDDEDDRDDDDDSKDDGGDDDDDDKDNNDDDDDDDDDDVSPLSFLTVTVGGGIRDIVSIALLIVITLFISCRCVLFISIASVFIAYSMLD